MGPAMAPAPTVAATSRQSRRKAWVVATVSASAPHNSRPGAIATAIEAPSPCSASTSAACSGLQSPSCSIGSSMTSNPISRTRGASWVSRSSVSGETQIHVLAPSLFIDLLAAPLLREARQVLATAQRVVQRRHVRLDVLVQRLLRDLRLREDPFLRDLFALQDLRGGDDGRPPLEVRVGRSDGLQTVFLPLGEEVVLVLARDERHFLARVLERLDGGDGGRAGVHPDAVQGAFLLQVVGDDRLRLGRITIGELDADDVQTGLVEDALGARPAGLEDVNARQDAEGEDLALRLDLLLEELGRVGTEGVAAD